jgi:HEAT repeat protein
MAVTGLFVIIKIPLFPHNNGLGSYQKVSKLSHNDNLSAVAFDEQRCIDSLGSLNPRQRSLAAEELGKLKAELAVTHLVECLEKDVNTYVRCASAEALGHIGDQEAIFPLIYALHDPCSFVRRAAAIALGQMQAKEAQGALLNALEDNNFYVRRAAINAIGKLNIPEMGLVLLPLLDTPDLRIRRTVLIALRRLQTEQAIPKMIAMLAAYLGVPCERDLPVVKTLVVALGDFGGTAAVPVLTDVVRGYVGARSLATGALGKIGDPRGGQVLVEALADKSINLQLAALKHLGRLKYHESLPAIREFLVASDPRLRRTAVLAIGQLKDKGAVPELLTMAYEDESPLVRPAAVEALGMVGDETMVAKLLPLVDDTNAYLRATLADVLCTLDGHMPDVRRALVQLTSDQVEHVANAAQRALYKWTKKNETERAAEAALQQVADKKQPSWFKRILGRA